MGISREKPQEPNGPDHGSDKKLPVAEPTPCNVNESQDLAIAKLFHKLWRQATDDNYFTLYGFRRFRTAHLLNLRFLEEEIDKLDHQIFQAGMRLGYTPSATDRLGLRHAKRDVNAQGAEEIVNQDLVLKLRDSVKQYGTYLNNLRFVSDLSKEDDGLASFNQIMMMETFALADDTTQSTLRKDFNPYETYKTRLVRVDLAQRNGSRDVLRHSFRKVLRYIWFFVCHRGTTENIADNFSAGTILEANHKRTYQNTTRLAEIITRCVVALLASAFLVFPLVVLSHQSSDEAHLITVSVCIVVFSLLISMLSKASNEQIMAASAGYAAVLVVFLSSSNP